MTIMMEEKEEFVGILRDTRILACYGGLILAPAEGLWVCIISSRGLVSCKKWYFLSFLGPVS